MSTITRDKVVTLTYRIEGEGGETLEQMDVPVNYLHGRDSGLVEKVERALDGKSVGDMVSVSIAPHEGFGDWNPELSFTDSIENVPPSYRQMGAVAEFVNDNGETMKMIVTHVDHGSVTLDGNHPFAGKTVTFHVKVVDIRDATAEEIRNGVAQMPESPVMH